MPEFESLLPDETLALANALTQRTIERSVIVDKISAELSGEPYVEEPLDVQRDSVLGRTVLLMAMVEDPKAPVSMIDMMDAVIGEKGYEHQAQTLSDETGFNLGGDNIRPVFATIAESLETIPGMTKEDMQGRFAKQMARIYQVAEENGITAVEVIESDEHYLEVQRRAATIEESAKNRRREVESINATLFANVLLQNLETILPKEELEGFTEEDINEAMLEFQLSPEINSELANVVDQQKELLRQAFFYDAVKTWGLEAVIGMLHTNQELMPQKPLVPTVNALFED